MNTNKHTQSALDYLKNKSKSEGISKDFLGFYHENLLEDASFVFLEEEGCALFDTSLEEIKNKGLFFSLEIIHPEDFERCAKSLMEFRRKKENEALTYFQRLKLKGEKKYQLCLTCASIDEEKGVFQCVTTPVTLLSGFNNEIEQTLNAETYRAVNEEIFKSLSEREKEIIGLVCQGKSTKIIADELFISSHTVEKHRKNINTKTKFSSNAELIQFALNFELV